MTQPRTSFFDHVVVLFRVRGVEIAFTPSWLGMVVVLALVFRTALPASTGKVAGAALSVGLTLIFYSCVLLHEAAHSVVAHVFGLQPRRILLFMLGGVSQIARDAETPKQEYLVALSGPLTSLVLGGALLLAAPPAAAGLPRFDGVWGSLALVNLMLASFNMIPGFPLDGGRVLRATVWAITGSRVRATRIAAAGGRIVAAGFIAGGVAFMLTQRQGVGGMFPGVLYIVLGWFLYSHASYAERDDVQRELAREQARRDLAIASAPAVPAADIVAGAGVTTTRDIVPAKRRVTPSAPKVRLGAKPKAKRTPNNAAANTPANAPAGSSPKGAKTIQKPAAKKADPHKRAAPAGKAKKTNESHAAKPEANPRSRGRAQRQATAGKTGSEPRNRSGDSRRRSADPRRGSSRGR